MRAGAGSPVDAHSSGPARLLLIDVDLEGERVAALGGYGGYMVLVGVGKGDNLHGGGEEGLFHGATDLCAL